MYEDQWHQLRFTQAVQAKAGRHHDWRVQELVDAGFDITMLRRLLSSQAKSGLTPKEKAMRRQAVCDGVLTGDVGCLWADSLSTLHAKQ